MKRLDRLCSGEKVSVLSMWKEVRMLRMRTFAALVEIGTGNGFGWNKQCAEVLEETS